MPSNRYADIQQEPFPHLVVEGALSSSDYEQLLSGWNTAIVVKGIARYAKENRTPAQEFPWKHTLAAQLMDAFHISGEPTIGRYMLRRTGYTLPPHIDPPNFILTILHYLPTEHQRDDIGTVLYHTQTPVYHSSDGAEYFTEACEPVKAVLFKPNTVLAFLNTPYSAHGIERFPEDRLAYQWHVVNA